MNDDSQCGIGPSSGSSILSIRPPRLIEHTTEKPGGATDKCQSRAYYEMDVLRTSLYLFHTIEDQAEKSEAPLPCSRQSQITSLLPHVSTIKPGP